MTLKFFRHKAMAVEPLSESELKVTWQLDDDLLSFTVTLKIQVPEMEIIEAEAVADRFPPVECQDAAEKIKMIEGVSVGSGLRKIVKGILGGEKGCSLLVDAVLECANAVILHYTRPGIQNLEVVTDPQLKKEALQEMVKANPRLVRSCIAFQDDSPIFS